MRVKRGDLESILKKTYLFNPLDSQEINQIIENSEIVFFESGKMIYLEESFADSIFIILGGEVELLKEWNYSLHPINHLFPTHILGLEDYGKNRLFFKYLRHLKRFLLGRRKNLT